MNANDQGPTFVVIWQTAAAFLVGVITFVTVSFIVNAAVVLVGLIPSEDAGDNSGWVDITRAIIPSVVGVYSARGVCDRFLTRYSRQAIFVLFTILALPVLAMAFRSGGRSWDHLLAFIAAGSMIGTAFVAFWQDKPLN